MKHRIKTQFGNVIAIQKELEGLDHTPFVSVNPKPAFHIVEKESVKKTFKYRFHQRIDCKTFEQAVELAEKIAAEIIDENEKYIKSYLDKFTAEQQAKGYKTGWIFYQMKDYFGYEIAQQFCAK